MTRCNFLAAAMIAAFIVAGASSTRAAEPFKPGETIRYAIKQTGVKAGEATLVFQGQTDRDGKKYALIVFTSKGFNFYDQEQIFVDTKTFLPQVVVRDLNIFGNKEKITEEYDQSAGTIKVSKVANGQSTIQTLQKKGPVDNIYGFIYRYRVQGRFIKDEKFDLSLPTMNVAIADVKDLDFNAAGKTYKAALMRSVPSKYSIWMDKSEKRIPLRIAGAVGIANTVMTMIEYKE